MSFFLGVGVLYFKHSGETALGFLRGEQLREAGPGVWSDSLGSVQRGLSP